MVQGLDRRVAAMGQARARRKYHLICTERRILRESRPTGPLRRFDESNSKLTRIVHNY